MARRCRASRRALGGLTPQRRRPSRRRTPSASAPSPPSRPSARCRRRHGEGRLARGPAGRSRRREQRGRRASRSRSTSRARAYVVPDCVMNAVADHAAQPAGERGEVALRVARRGSSPHTASTSRSTATGDPSPGRQRRGQDPRLAGAQPRAGELLPVADHRQRPAHGHPDRHEGEYGLGRPIVPTVTPRRARVMVLAARPAELSLSLRGDHRCARSSPRPRPRRAPSARGARCRHSGGDRARRLRRHGRGQARRPEDRRRRRVHGQPGAVVR